jgi:hypothetical protein
MTAEHWLPVVGHEGIYEVSDRGRVRSLERVILVNGPQQVRTIRARILKQHPRDTGHMTVGLRSPARTAHVHHLVLEAFAGPRPPGLWGCHNDGVAANNHVSNLRWDTPQSNVHDTIRHGTNPRLVRRERCLRGHRMCDPNLVYRPKRRPGARECLACKRGYANAREAEGRGEYLDVQVAADAHYERIMAGLGRRRAPNARLTEDNVRVIRATPPYHGRNTELARRYGVSWAVIRNVLSGATWKWVSP